MAIYFEPQSDGSWFIDTGKIGDVVLDTSYTVTFAEQVEFSNDCVKSRFEELDDKAHELNKDLDILEKKHKRYVWRKRGRRR